jgi:hypothetical protein
MGADRLSGKGPVMSFASMFDTESPSVFVVLAEPSPEQEPDFHDWYDKIHGPDALDNGSFRALHRYRAAGPGWTQARYLAVWQGRYLSEPEAWAYIRPRAKALRAAGRVGEVASVVWALMMLAVPVSGQDSERPVLEAPARSLTTVQNDWRRPDPATSATDWWKTAGLDEAPSHGRVQLYTSDADGGGGGYHLALIEEAVTATEAAGAWRGIGAAGMSPTPPYRTIFAEAGEEPERADQRGGAGEDAPAMASTWVMHWEHVTSLT